MVQVPILALQLALAHQLLLEHIYLEVDHLRICHVHQVHSVPEQHLHLFHARSEPITLAQAAPPPQSVYHAPQEPTVILEQPCRRNAAIQYWHKDQNIVTINEYGGCNPSSQGY